MMFEPMLTLKRDHAFRQAIIALILLVMASGLWAENSNLRLELQTGLALNTIESETPPALRFEEYPKIVGNFGFGIGYKLATKVSNFISP